MKSLWSSVKSLCDLYKQTQALLLSPVFIVGLFPYVRDFTGSYFYDAVRDRPIPNIHHNKPVTQLVLVTPPKFLPVPSQALRRDGSV